MAKKVLNKHQCLLDFALQEAGDATALFELALLNGIGCTDILNAGAELEAPTIINKQVVKTFSANSIKPATLDDETQIPGGIGYMAIGVNFKVS